MAALNADPLVMRYFPSTYDRDHTAKFIERNIAMLADYGYCYFAVDQLEDQEFIGFIGLAYQDYEASFTPCTDIGWRLAHQYWGRGYATEGAKACLDYARTKIPNQEVVAVATSSNILSIRVMQKIGMQYDHTFTHSQLLDYPNLKECVLYRNIHT